ncbi:hypothetical protein BSG1_03915 [Bacillus sp. SG-1]|nr:hypothetical protein BSG1_03915 [Bacillus sp. SG-1]
MLVMGIEEIQKERKTIGLSLVGVFILPLFVAIQGFLLTKKAAGTEIKK